MPITSSGTEVFCMRNREAGGARAQGGRRRAGRGGDRPQARVRRPLRRQGRQGQAGAEPAQADRAHRGRGAGRHFAAHAALPVRARAAQRAGGAGERGAGGSSVRRQAGAHRRVARGPARRAPGDHRPERPRQVDASPDRHGSPGPRRGSVRWGHEARVGYFPQDHREVLTDAEQTRSRFRRGGRARESPTFVRGQLGRILFSGGDVEKRIGSLSGGEAARLIFAPHHRREAERPRARRADQPPRSRGHPRARRRPQRLSRHRPLRVARSLVRVGGRHAHREVTPDGPRDFPGTYAEYLERCGDDHLDADAVVLKAKKPRPEGAAIAGPPRRSARAGTSRSAAATAPRSCPRAATR